MNILIIAAGEPNPRSLLHKLIGECAHIIAVDGGTRVARQARLVIHQFVGDGDSIRPNDRAWLESKNTEATWHPVEKDQTDLELAFDLAIEHKPRSIHVLGGWGGRADHTFSNIFLMEKAVANGIETTLWADYEKIQLRYPGDVLFEDAWEGQHISLIPISNSVEGVLTQGLYYPLYNETLHRAAGRGVSNRVDKLPASISFTKGVLLVVRAFDRQHLDALAM